MEVAARELDVYREREVGSRHGIFNARDAKEKRERKRREFRVPGRQNSWSLWRMNRLCRGGGGRKRKGGPGGGKRGTEGAGGRFEDASERIGERIAGRNEMVEFIVPRDTELVPLRPQQMTHGEDYNR